MSKTVLKQNPFDGLSRGHFIACPIGDMFGGHSQNRKQKAHLYTRWIASRAQHSTTLNTAMNKDAHTNNTRIISQVQVHTLRVSQY